MQRKYRLPATVTVDLFKDADTLKAERDKRWSPSQSTPAHNSLDTGAQGSQRGSDTASKCGAQLTDTAVKQNNKKPHKQNIRLTQRATSCFTISKSANQLIMANLCGGVSLAAFQFQFVTP